jgi:hypothetical protein
MKRPPLHTRPDEEQDTEEIDFYCYKGCNFCGNPHHILMDCPIRKTQPWQTRLNPRDK